MSSVKIKLNSAGIQELLKSQEVKQACEQKAQEIADRADGNWNVTTKIRKDRAAAEVHAGDRDTYYRNLSKNTLMRAVH